MKILIGTHNENKLRQFRQSFARFGSGFELFSLDDVGIHDEVEENSDSLFENAKNKAKYYGGKSGVITLSDDLGLFVDALDGQPGVHAKRWLSGSDKDRYMKILECMKDIPREKRTCRYRSILAVYFPEKDDFWTYKHNLEGIIAFTDKEEKGFGYDPIVLINGKYYSELSDEERFRVNHRGLGVEKLIEYLLIQNTKKDYPNMES